MDETWYEYCWNKTDYNIYPECMDFMSSESSPGERSKTLSIIFLVVLIILCIVGNSLVLIAFIAYRRLRVITHYYIVSLAVSDLIVGLVSMPIWLSYEITGFANLPTWINEIKMIEAMEFIDIVSCISSIVNLAAISIDRFFGIVMPLKHKTLVTEKSAICFISSAWLYSFIIAGVKFVPRFADYMIFNFVAGYAVPLVVICGCYLFIFIKVKEHAKRKLSNQLSKQWTLARTISIVISLFVLCWTPFFVIVLLYQYCLSCTFFEKPWFEYVPGIIKTLHYFNSCCNPFVYGVCNVNFRSAYKGIFYKCLGKEMKPSPYDISIIGSRNASIRNRSNTCNSVLSYTEPSTVARDPETDDLLCLNTERLRTSSFTRQDSSCSSKLPKPLSPTKLLENEPRLLLKQKFQRGASFEQYSPTRTEAVVEIDCLLDKQSNYESEHAQSQRTDEESLTSQMCFVESFQNSTLLEIDSLLSDAKESDI